MSKTLKNKIEKLEAHTQSGLDPKYIEQAKKIRLLRPLRKSDIPDRLPERYCSLAIRALRAGKLSLMQFKKFVGVTYKEAEEYLVDDEDFTDEKISISVA